MIGDYPIKKNTSKMLLYNWKPT